jgi:RNA polymerase sigma-70 factor (ECF subfamily)
MSDDRDDRLRSHLKSLFGFAFSLTGERDTARDLVQETALKTLSAKNVPEDAAAFRVWLFRILRNAFVDDVRRRKPVCMDPEDLEQLAPSDDWSEHRQINVVAVQQGFVKLSPEHRQVLALVDVAGMSYAEAAAALDVPVGTIMSRVSRARAALLQQIEPDNVAPFPVAGKQV